jgi:2-polyprenyl-3-methyl-5-hydroxy-6-metoxy-1,4-benzoquinol methylase
MSDLFEQKAKDWDARPFPAQISAGVGRALLAAVPLRSDQQVLDFGAGTGLICAQVAPHVARVFAVDISRAMLDQLAQKPELSGKVETICQDILEQPLGRRVDVVVSAMAMHHVRDTERLIRVLAELLVPGGQLALADLDSEDGSFHPPQTEGVFHHGFDRDALSRLLERHGFSSIQFRTAQELQRDGQHYSVFLVTAVRA